MYHDLMGIASVYFRTVYQIVLFVFLRDQSDMCSGFNRLRNLTLRVRPIYQCFGKRHLWKSQETAWPLNLARRAKSILIPGTDLAALRDFRGFRLGGMPHPPLRCRVAGRISLPAPKFSSCTQQGEKRVQRIALCTKQRDGKSFPARRA